MSDNAELDAAALRREARRRKILENSENRLKLITGSVSSLEKETKPTPEADVEVSCGSNDDKHYVFQNSLTSNDSAINDVNDPIAQISNLIKQASLEEEQDELLEKEEIREKSYIDVLIDNRMHYIFLATIILVLLYFNLGIIFYDNVICPFYTVKLIELIALKNRQQNSHSNLFMALWMAGLKPSVVSTFQKVYFLVVTTAADFFLYTFIIILGAKLLIDIKDD